MAFMTKYELLTTYAYIWFVMQKQGVVQGAEALQVEKTNDWEKPEAEAVWEICQNNADFKEEVAKVFKLPVGKVTQELVKQEFARLSSDKRTQLKGLLATEQCYKLPPNQPVCKRAPNQPVCKRAQNKLRAMLEPVKEEEAESCGSSTKGESYKGTSTSSYAAKTTSCSGGTAARTKGSSVSQFAASSNVICEKQTHTAKVLEDTKQLVRQAKKALQSVQGITKKR